MSTAAEMYIKDIKSIKLLPEEKQNELAVKFKQTGDIKFRNKLAEQSMRYALTIVNKMYNRYPQIAIEDIISVANMGCVTAANKFDPSRGVPFCLYSRMWVQSFIQTYVKNNKTVFKMPGNKAVRKLDYCTIDINSIMFADPDSRDIALDKISKKLKVSKKDIEDYIEIRSTKIVHFDRASQDDDGDGRTLHDKFVGGINQGPQAAFNKTLFSKYKEIMETLPERTRIVVERILFNEEQFSVVGRDIGVCRERVRQIYAAGIDSLQKKFAHTEGFDEVA